MSEQPKLSVEEAICTLNEALKEHCWLISEYNKKGGEADYQTVSEAANAISFLHTHATNDANLVPLDKVLSVLERIQSDADFASHLYLSQAITQIKNLTKE